MILKCTSCKPHKYQDNKYGFKKRVCNATVTAGQYRCTVCGKLINK